MATYQTRICDYGGVERSAGDAALSAYYYSRALWEGLMSLTVPEVRRLSCRLL